MQFLKADTAATILIGPFLDKGDGVTPETGITLGAADAAELMKHDGTTFVDLTSDSRAFTHKQGGMYTLVLGTGDTDTEGRLMVFIADDDVCLPVWKDFMVVNANVYDSLFAAATTDYLQVDALQLGGATQSATDLKDLADTGYDPSTHKVQGVVLADTVTALTGHTVQTGDGYAIVNSGTHGNSALKTLIDAVPTASEIQTEMEEDGASLLDTIRDDLANGTDGLGALKALIDTLDTVADAIKAVTDNLPDSGALDDLAAILTDTGTTLPATLATIAAYIDAEVAAILTDTGTTLPATLATIAGYLDTEIAAIKAKTDLRPSGVPKNVALSNFTFLMVLSSDHITPATGKTVTAQISKDGDAFANTTNSVSEIAGGFYKIDITQTEMNADVVALKFTETDCDQRSISIVTST